jgi:hypothetical protein
MERVNGQNLTKERDSTLLCVGFLKNLHISIDKIKRIKIITIHNIIRWKYKKIFTNN